MTDGLHSLWSLLCLDATTRDISSCRARRLERSFGQGGRIEVELHPLNSRNGVGSRWTAREKAIGRASAVALALLECRRGRGTHGSPLLHTLSTNSDGVFGTFFAILYAT